jgi:hypothetical protein
VTDIGAAVLAIAGPIGAGKTTTAAALGHRLGWRHTGYGDVIRTIAASSCASGDRATLQQIGLDLIAAGWESFTRRVLDHAGWAAGRPLILDGLRHLAGGAALSRAVAPLPVRVIYLDLPASTGLARARERDQLPGSPGNSGLHPVERDLPALREHSDLVIPTLVTGTEQITSQIIGYLASHPARTTGDRCA